MGDGSRLESLSPEERLASVERWVARAMATVLGTDEVHLYTRLDDLGMDSLMSVELSTALERACGRRVPTMELMSLGSGRAIAEHLARGEAPPDDSGGA
jgi:acyl carrier protein